MEKETSASAMLAGSRPHYEVLNGLRGVAALVVICFHFFEAFATSVVDQRINHGYLAVDFFFLLSGFVLGYAYDKRWEEMSVGDFIKRRIIRLHPMVVIAALLGAITFIVQGSVQWQGETISFLRIGFATLLTLFLIPTFPGGAAEVRGNGEMFPLNGPSWSLFFEYLVSFFYAFTLRKFSTKKLVAFLIITGGGLAFFALGNLSGDGHLGVGWTMGGYNFLGGSLRVLFSFTAGLLISRTFRPRKIKGAFAIASLILIALLAMPHLQILWLNGLYDVLCITLFFPILICIGASGVVASARREKFYRFLGDISYPIYIIHYPFMYLFYAWVWGSGRFEREDLSSLTLAQAWPVIVGMFFGFVILAYGFLKLYDEPVRKRLNKVTAETR